MDEKIKELKKRWEETLKNIVPINSSENLENIHIGMFKIHGHRIDEMTTIIENL